jgi:hypothetical protein
MFIGAAALMLAATGSAWSKSKGNPSPNGCEASGDKPKKCDDAPEIDAASGTSAIALASGIVLLMRERSRSRRSSRKDDSEK